MSAAHIIKPIRTAADYRHALAQLDAIVSMPERERDYDSFDVLGVLVHGYEEQHHPIDPPDPVDAILFRLEQQGLTKSALVRYLGSRHRISEILNRHPPLSIAMIQALHEGLGIPAEILIRRDAKTPIKQSRPARKNPLRSPSPTRRSRTAPQS